MLGIFAYLDHNFYVASVPTVRVKVHLRRLLEAGYKVRVEGVGKDGVHVCFMWK